ncbi:hypothetical protein ACFSJQ_17560 [Vibrio olivae]
MIEQVYQGSISSHRIGMANVHQRLALLYGNGMTITRLEPGTEVSFYAEHIEEVTC